MSEFRKSPAQNNMHHESIQSDQILNLLARTQKFRMFFAGLIFAIISFIGANPIHTSCILLKIFEIIALFSLLFAGILLLIRLNEIPFNTNDSKNPKNVIVGLIFNCNLSYWILFLVGMFLLTINRSILLF